MSITKKPNHAALRKKHVEMMPKTPKIAASKYPVGFETFSCNPPHLSTLLSSVHM